MLPLTNSRDGASSGVKYHLNCRDRIEIEKTTKSWVSGLKYLSTTAANKANMPHTKLLEGILDSNHDIVIKVADDSTDSLANEWRIHQLLREHKCEGFMRYICYFECADNIANVSPARGYVCQGPGSGLNVLMMEFINNASFGEYAWRDIIMFRACCKQLVCSMVDAHDKIRFRHNDLHPKNVLLKRTTKASITYECGATVPCAGMRVVVMDLELSKTGANSRFLFMDLWTFFGKVLTMERMNDRTVSPVTDFFSAYKMHDDVDSKVALKALHLIDEIEFARAI
jgi:hypothetical protein